MSQRAAGDIRFENVIFAYPNRPVTLGGVTFHIRSGETIALTGLNGAGKTGPVDCSWSPLFMRPGCLPT